MMHNASLPNMRLPVFCAPMFLLSGPKMVIAACKSGIAGAFPGSNCRDEIQMDDWVSQITEALGPDDAPWVVNLVTHSTNTRLPGLLKVVEKYKPPVVITALGSPKPVMEVVQSYGGRVFADVINLTLARKAAEAGVEGMACISAGAGGHTGYLSPFAFISAVREFFAGTVVVGGAISDGAGIAGALAAGADYVYMGTRFIPTHECMADPAYKQMVLDASIDDVIVSPVVTGTPASWLKESLAAAGYDPSNPAAAPTRDYSGKNSKRWKDIWAAGQGVGRSREIESVADVTNTLENEFRNATRHFVSAASRFDRL